MRYRQAKKWVGRIVAGIGSVQIAIWLGITVGLVPVVMAMPLSAQDVYIVDTVDRAESRQLGQTLGEQCAACGHITYVNMGGNMRAAREVASRLEALEEEGALSLVVTLGKPATRIIANRLKRTPVLYTLVGEPIPEFQSSERVKGFPTDAPVALQLDVLREMAPSIHSAGIVLSEKHQAKKRYQRIATAEGLKFYWIDNEKEMPDALRRAVRQNDAVIFLRDSMVINKDTVRFLLQYTLENGRHTLGYSRPLVDMGLTAGLVPKPEAFGALVGHAAQEILSGETVSPKTADRSFYDIHLNEKVLSQLSRRTGPQVSVKGR